MISKNFTKIGGIGALGILFLGSLVYAQNAPLSATCSGTANLNVITWTASPAGGNQPYSYQWSGTNVTGTTQTVTATYNSTGTFSAAVTVMDTATTTASSSAVNANCSATVTTLPAATSTPPSRKFKQPMLNINPPGNFLARGMEVVSVGANSFVGKVWGTTWTIDTSGLGEFLLREGKLVRRVIDVSILQPGDEVGVSGRVDPATPLVVKAKVVRNYSIVLEREVKFKVEDEDNNDKDKEKKGRSSSSTEVQGIRDQLKAILDQIKELQGKIKGRSD
ncbi:MAG: hypothetical protein HYT13_02000 [Candidatus Liptonbacteria bacterium]|nr:hypothetical protein [Candidatus Liptonbacteria bacterium]